MSTTSNGTWYSYMYSGNSLVETSPGPFQVAIGASGVAASFGDAAAIQLAAALQSAFRAAGFADATVTVTKTVDQNTLYSVVNGAFA